jgi:hypothetical protein
VKAQPVMAKAQWARAHAAMVLVGRAYRTEVAVARTAAVPQVAVAAAVVAEERTWASAAEEASRRA